MSEGWYVGLLTAVNSVGINSCRSGSITSFRNVRERVSDIQKLLYNNEVEKKPVGVLNVLSRLIIILI